MTVAGPSDSGRVRPLAEGDRERWLGLWAAYLSFYRAQLADGVTELTFARLRDREDNLAGLVAVDGGDQAVGFAHLVFHPGTWSRTANCYLEDLFVDPHHRGGRVAPALFDAVYAHARERGAGRVYWHTQQFNGRARSLYDTVGTLTSFVVYEHALP